MLGEMIVILRYVPGLFRRARLRMTVLVLRHTLK
jgi:hypothetical protein